jgi:hypothetical protein
VVCAMNTQVVVGLPLAIMSCMCHSDAGLRKMAAALPLAGVVRTQR